MKVNHSKSEVVLVRDVRVIDVLANILGCKVGILSINYLSMPSGLSFKVAVVWNPIVEKMERRLLGWKKLYLSKVGRMMLIKRMQ